MSPVGSFMVLWLIRVYYIRSALLTTHTPRSIVHPDSILKIKTHVTVSSLAAQTYKAICHLDTQFKGVPTAGNFQHKGAENTVFSLSLMDKKVDALFHPLDFLPLICLSTHDMCVILQAELVVAFPHPLDNDPLTSK